MSSATRRGGIPGPESRTGLTRPSMTEAEFERRLGAQRAAAETASPDRADRRRARAASPRPTSRAPRRPRPRAVASRAGQAGQAAAGPADVRHRGGPGQEALALRHPPGQGPLRGRQRPAPADRRLDGALRLPRPPRRPKRRADLGPQRRGSRRSTALDHDLDNSGSAASKLTVAVSTSEKSNR